MQTSGLFLRVVVVSLLVGGGLWGSRAVARASDDEALESKIEARLAKDAALNERRVHVDVDDGVAKLSGTVQSEAIKKRAARLARVPGVSRVDNEIAVRPPGTKEMNALREETGDTWITTQIKTELVGDGMLLGSDISVDTQGGGLVTLTGKVKSEHARNRAVEVAASVKGVKRVSNQLRLGP